MIRAFYQLQDVSGNWFYNIQNKKGKLRQSHEEWKSKRALRRLFVE